MDTNSTVVFPEHFSEIQRELFHMLNSLAMISAHALSVYGAMDIWQGLNIFAKAIVAWNVMQDIISEEEMEEVMEFGAKQAKREALEELKAELEPNTNTDELEAIFNAPSYGEMDAAFAREDTRVKEAKEKQDIQIDPDNGYEIGSPEWVEAEKARIRQEMDEENS